MATTIQPSPITPAQAAIKIQNSGAIKQAGAPTNMPEGAEIKKNSQDPAVKLTLTSPTDVKKMATAYAPPTKTVATNITAESALKVTTGQGPAAPLSLSENGLKAQAATDTPAANRTAGPSNRVLSTPVNTAALQKPAATPNPPVNEDLKRMMSTITTQIAEAPKKALEAQSNQKPQNVLSLLE